MNITKQLKQDIKHAIEEYIETKGDINKYYSEEEFEDQELNIKFSGILNIETEDNYVDGIYESSYETSRDLEVDSVEIWNEENEEFIEVIL